MKLFARVSEFLDAGDMRGAIFAASKSNKLGKYRNAILDAKLAYQSPSFLIQVKKDPAALILAGHEAVKALCASCEQTA